MDDCTVEELGESVGYRTCLPRNRTSVSDRIDNIEYKIIEII